MLCRLVDGGASGRVPRPGGQDRCARSWSRASAKAAGVVVDDTAVTPQYVHGLAAERELPIIRRIAVGSLRNKLLFILPAALLLSELLPWLLTPLLMLGGTYLCYEGVEKLWELLHPQDVAHGDAAGEAPADEEQLVKGAIRTDFILSAEIMVISLDEVADEPLLSRAVILVLVAFAITAVVYGAVALIVKMDDAGLKLARTKEGSAASFGTGLVRAMPVVLSVLSKVGIAAMIWVGGHIILVGLDELGVHFLYDAVHHLEEDVHGGVPGWLVNTAASAVLGLLVGALVLAVAHGRKKH